MNDTNLLDNLTRMEHQGSNPTRRFVTHKVKEYWMGIKKDNDQKQALKKLEQYVSECADNATSDIERITFIEVLDTIHRRG